MIGKPMPGGDPLPSQKAGLDPLLRLEREAFRRKQPLCKFRARSLRKNRARTKCMGFPPSPPLSPLGHGVQNARERIFPRRPAVVLFQSRTLRFDAVALGGAVVGGFIKYGFLPTTPRPRVGISTCFVEYPPPTTTQP